jgi:DNA oxidative demethylase
MNLQATPDLFEATAPRTESLAAGACVLRGFARSAAPALRSDLEAVLANAPLRHMVTPGGFRMSVAMTNCGDLGWVSDLGGYRYDRIDPEAGGRWPALPESLLQLAGAAAAQAGFSGFVPDACLINRYLPGTRLSLHQDRNERDFGWPIVSVSLGLPAVFLFGGTRRAERAVRVPLEHGDVVVWGGPARLRYHGVLPLKPGWHAVLGEQRINLTLRRAG